MRGFEFRLEKLLGMKRLVAEQASRELAVAREAVATQNVVLLALTADQEQATSELRELQTRTLELERLVLASAWLASLDRRLRRERRILEEREGVEQEKLAALTKARKDVRVLEKFRERQWNLYQKELNRKDRILLDEIGQNRAKGA
jgi:flagellar FliJ protein